MHRTPEEIKRFVREHAAGTYNKDLTAMVNDRFGTKFSVGSIAELKSVMGVYSGIDSKIRKGTHLSPATEFKKGHVPLNKGTKGMYPLAGGATRYKKGNVPANYLPVGTENKDSEGYWKVKTADPNVWQFKHRLLWEQAHGPIPKGMVVTFIDGNRDNCVLDNLDMIERNVQCRMNKLGLKGDSAELGKAAILTGKVIAAVHEMKRTRRPHKSNKEE